MICNSETVYILNFLVHLVELFFYFFNFENARQGKNHIIIMIWFQLLQCGVAEGLIHMGFYQNELDFEIYKKQWTIYVCY